MNEALAKLDSLKEVLDAESRGFNQQAVVIKINHQDAGFTIPGLPATKRLTGIILASKKVRVFFPRMGVESDTKKMLGFTNNRPFCSSRNYLTGNLVDADWDSVKKDKESTALFLKNKIAEGVLQCADCPLNEWESVRLLGQSGRGKACRELRRLLYWQLGMIVPTILTIPTSSIRNWDAYCSGLQFGNRNHYQVVTEIAVEQKETPGNRWAIVKFTMDSEVDQDMAAELMAEVIQDGKPVPLINALINIFKGRDLGLDEYPTNGGSSDVKEEEF